MTSSNGGQQQGGGLMGALRNNPAVSQLGQAAKDYAKASGEKHPGCAKGCISKGGKWALAMKDGLVLLDIDKETAEKHLGHPVTVKGTLDKGTNTVKVASVEMSH